MGRRGDAGGRPGPGCACRQGAGTAGGSVGAFIGLDVGTTSVSAVALDMEAARPLATVSLPHGAGRAGAAPGRAELDLDALWGAAQEALGAVAARASGAGSIGGVGVTGQMHGLALVRPDGTPLAPAITWLISPPSATPGALPPAVH